jgi:hypothetical protein
VVLPEDGAAAAPLLGGQVREDRLNVEWYRFPALEVDEFEVMLEIICSDCPTWKFEGAQDRIRLHEFVKS